MRRRAIAAALALACLPAPAEAAQRLITIETPSRFVDPRVANWNGNPKPRTPRANILLPNGYDGRRRFPLLLLLHGAGGRWDDWAKRGEIARVARGLPAVVVMPDAATGFYSDWWNGGRRGAPGWESYFREELIPTIERRFRILPGRRSHTVAGLSMGGHGATYLAAQRPEYFGTAVTMSGFVSIQRPELDLGFSAVARVSYESVFGPRRGFYAAGHNPFVLAENLAHTRVLQFTGNGIPRPGVSGSPAAMLVGGIGEFDLRVQNDDFARALREAGADTSYTVHLGVHDWPYWREDLATAIGRGLFRPVDEHPSRWSYRTVAQRGRMWGLRFAFSTPPAAVAQFTRDGSVLRGEGAGAVTVGDARGCSFSAALPFTRTLPSRPCRRIRLTLAPRRLRAGRRVRLRVSATSVVDGRRVPVGGVRVRSGRAAARTNSRGRATLAIRPRGRRVRVTASRRDYLSGAATVRVLRRRR